MENIFSKSIQNAQKHRIKMFIMTITQKTAQNREQNSISNKQIKSKKQRK